VSKLFWKNGTNDLSTIGIRENMRCPKCGFNNPDGTLFCEECDWRTDQPYKREVSVSRIYFPILAMVLGIIAVVMWYLDIAYGAIVCGAIGMVFGGYSTTFVRITDQSNRTMMLVLAMIGILASVVGFMMGITLL